MNVWPRIALRGDAMRLTVVLLLALVPSAAVAQTSHKDDKTVLLSGTTTHLRVASPDDTVVVNSKVMRVSEYLSLLASLDNLAGRNPRNPATQSYGTPTQAAPPESTDSPCRSKDQASSEAEPCSESKHQAPASTPPHS